MSRIPRTPVHFPRMKVRGKRNRRKSRARLETVYVIPAGTIVRNDGGEYTITAGVPVGVATHSFRFSQWRDGWGRPVPAPRPRARPPVAHAHSMSIELNQAAAGSLFDLITGSKDE